MHGITNSVPTLLDLITDIHDRAINIRHLGYIGILEIAYSRIETVDRITDIIHRCTHVGSRRRHGIANTRCSITNRRRDRLRSGSNGRSHTLGSSNILPHLATDRIDIAQIVTKSNLPITVTCRRYRILLATVDAPIGLDNSNKLSQSGIKIRNLLEEKTS